MALITSLHVLPDAKLKMMPKASPGPTPFVGGGGTASAPNPAVVWNCGLRLFPPGNVGVPET